MTTDAAYDAAVELSAAIAAEERRVLCMLLTHRRTAEPIVRAAGLSVAHFAQDDHRLIFAGWLVACENDLATLMTLRVIRRALREAALWDPSTPRESEGMHHSDATLAAMACTPMSVEEFGTSRRAVGWDGDWTAFTIARHVNALVSAMRLAGEVRA